MTAEEKARWDAINSLLGDCQPVKESEAYGLKDEQPKPKAPKKSPTT